MEFLQQDQSYLSTNIFENIRKYSHEEYQYLDLIENILANGNFEKGRNGNTKSIFGGSMRFLLNDGARGFKNEIGSLFFDPELCFRLIWSVLFILIFHYLLSIFF